MGQDGGGQDVIMLIGVTQRMYFFIIIAGEAAPIPTHTYHKIAQFLLHFAANSECCPLVSRQCHE